MNKIFKKIVDHLKLIISVFLIAAVVCGVCRQFVAVDYDMNDYLPEESPSTVALDTMQSEYSGGIPNARVMVSDVTISEALDYKKQIEAVDGVTDVTWLDDRTDITMPQEIMDDETVDQYYKDSNALFTVTIESDKRISAVSDIRGIYEKKEAVIETVKATAVSILTSGTVLTVVGILMGVISSHRVLSQLGMFPGRGTLCSLGTVLFVLPGLLYLADRAIMRRSRKKQAGNV